jgi:mannose-6-phosphate isomerase-like protein (cupin superfamily)
MSTTQLNVAFTPVGENAHNAPTLNVMGMPTAVKMAFDQTGEQFSSVEVDLAPLQMGPPPHIHYQLDEIMRVLEGTVTVLEGDTTREVTAGGWHFRPRGIVHTFWNAHNAPAKFIDMYPGTQNFAHYLEELAALGYAIHSEGGNPFAPENLARFKALDAQYNHEVFYEKMPEHMAKYGPK